MLRKRLSPVDGGILESAMNSGLVMQGSKYGVFVVALDPVVCGGLSTQASMVHSRLGEHCWGWGASTVAASVIMMLSGTS